MRKLFADSDSDFPIRLSAAVTLQPAGPGHLLAISEEDTILLEGEALIAAVGCFSRSDFRAALLELETRFAKHEIEAALTTLAVLGVIKTTPQATNVFTTAYWDAAGLSLPRSAGLRVRSFLPSGDGWLRGALEGNGISVDEQSQRSLALAADYLDPALADVAEEDSEWLLAKPAGHTIWLGPLFVPGRSVCWKCLASWLRANRPLVGAFEPEGPGRLPQQPWRAMLPSTMLTAAGLLATIAASWLARGEYRELESTIQTLDTRTLEWRRHRLRPAAACSACRLLPEPGSLTAYFDSHCGCHSLTVVARNGAASVSERSSAETESGGQRPSAPGLHDLVSPICGIVSRLTVSAEPFASYFFARADLAPPLPVTGARPALRCIRVSGRGASVREAEQSCIGEAVERYSAIFQGNERRRTARFEELSDAGISPRSVFLFSDAQYRDRDVWNRRLPDGHSIPHPADPSAPMEWTEVTSLANGSGRYVPSAYCYLWYETPLHPTTYFADTNGCAAGPTMEAATLSALLELIERDALAIWWDNCLQRPGWEIADLKSRELLTCRDELARAGRELQFLDITTDLGVPACVAVAARRDGTEPFFAAAAALDAASAARRAAGELAGIIFRSAPHPGGPYYDWVRQAQLRAQPYLAADGSACAPEGSRPADGDEGIAQCIAALSSCGLHPYLLDLTRPEIRIPAVRAIVPGLRHHWGRYAPGRLYDVPVRMGWRTRAVLESELNPNPCVL
jgi:oxazoline/thiazoline synthase